MTIRVLLADDHAMVRDGLQSLLESEDDIEVVGATGDGREAVRMVEKLRPDLALMDISMPGLNGIEATAEIADRFPDTRIIILSMHHTTEHIFQALKAGARGYLLKESAGSEVVTALRTVHKGGRYLSKRIEETVIDDYVRLRRSPDAASPMERLSHREREILQLVVEGKSSAEAAEILCISPKTVETYRSRLMRKLGVGDLPGLVKFALRHGLTSLDT